MSKIEDGGPAFPTSIEWGPEGGVGFDGDEAGKPNSTTYYSGMTLRQYAAIKLRVPNSGTDWLDDMIRASLRDEFAAKAMVAIETRGDNGGRDPSGFLGDGATGSDESALVSYWIADAMLAAREGKR